MGEFAVLSKCVEVEAIGLGGAVHGHVEYP